MTTERKRLYRSRNDRMLFGVIGGFSDYTGFDPSLLRIGYILLTLITGFFPGLLFYLLMAVVVPSERREGD